jgi:malate dehydrogenase
MSHASSDRGADHSDGALQFSSPPATVLITGAAGAVAYSLCFFIAKGLMLGPARRVRLVLFDLPAMATKLEGLIMELEDLACPLFAGASVPATLEVAFSGVDFALLVGARPRGPGMERRDLLAANVAIFQEMGEALERVAPRTVKVVVVGNPANTNAAVLAAAAPSLPRGAITCLTRLDHNRAVAALAKRAECNPGDLNGVVVWGNHSSTQFADARFAMREGHPRPSDSTAVRALVAEPAWLGAPFVAAVQARGGEVLAKRGLTSAASAASAIVDHVRDWVAGTRGNWVSMGVPTDGVAYGVKAGIFFSMPCIWCVQSAPLQPPPPSPPPPRAPLPHPQTPFFTFFLTPTFSDGQGNYRVETGLSLDAFARNNIERTEAELLEERDAAFAVMAPGATKAAPARVEGPLPVPLLAGGLLLAALAVVAYVRRSK